jgi:sugar phosphate permease
MAVFFERLSLGMLMMLFFLIGSTTSSIGALAIIMGTEPFPRALAGTSMGATNLYPFVGAVIFQPLMGYVLDRGGRINGVYTIGSYKALSWMLLLLSLIALVSIAQSKDSFSNK